MKTIKLIKTKNKWYAAYSDFDPKMLNLLGTNIVPTTFSADTSVDVVLAKVSNLNPEYLVIVS